jgi:hypothetical protein
MPGETFRIAQNETDHAIPYCTSKCYEESVSLCIGELTLLELHRILDKNYGLVQPVISLRGRLLD